MNRAVRNALPALSAGFSSFSPKCASAHCKPRSRFSLSFRSEGIRIGNEWYCGPDCFEEEVLVRLARLSASRSVHAKSRMPRMPLGLAALSLGHITTEQLQAALQHQRENGGRIGEILIALGFATDTQVTASLAAQWGHPMLSLHERQISVPQRIPTRLLELYSMLPIHYVAQTNKLVIGFAELVEHRILSTIETMLGCTVVPCFITADDFAHQFPAARLQQSCNGDEVLFEQRASLPEIARVARSYASQIGAVSARFGLCSDYLWSRLEGSRVSVDVLSKI